MWYRLIVMAMEHPLFKNDSPSCKPPDRWKLPASYVWLSEGKPNYGDIPCFFFGMFNLNQLQYSIYSIIQYVFETIL